MSGLTEKIAAKMISDPRWAAVVARDPKADGQFYYSVKTTGVYCRPSCGSRTPKPENVSFYLTTEDAEHTGFRPCKRCKPDQPPLAELHAALVAGLCRLIESAETEPSLDELARSAQMSTFHLHRIFKAVTGVTPKAYAAAYRARKIREELGSSESVTKAIYEAGYNSSGRFYEKSNQVLGMSPTKLSCGRCQYGYPICRGRMFAGRDSGCLQRTGRLRHPAGRRSRYAGARPARSFPERQPDWRRCRI